MTWSKPLTGEEVEFIRQTYQQLGPTACARKLGRSKSVVKARAKEMGLTGRRPPRARVAAAADPRPDEPDGARQDTLGRLREARDLLKREMLEVDPRNVAAIVKEYRACCMQVEELEAGAVGGGGGGLADALREALSGAAASRGPGV